MYHERSRAILRSSLRPALRLTMLAVSDHADEHGSCWPSAPTLSAETGLDERTVRRSLKELEAMGALVSESRAGRTTVFRVVVEAIPERATPGHVPTPGTTPGPGTVPATPGIPPTPPRAPRPEPRAPRPPNGTRTSQGNDPGNGSPVVADATPEPRPPKRKPSGAYQLAIDAWTLAHREAFDAEYPWQFQGRDADGARVKSWLATARVTEDDPATGIARLRGAFLAYFAAVKAGTSWPKGDPATTKGFTRDIAKWLRTPSRGPPGSSGDPMLDRIRKLEF